MPLTDILVHIDSAAASSTRVEAAIALGAEHGARVTGLFVVTHQYYQSSHGKEQEMISQAREQFDAAAGAAGVESRWICADWSVVGVNASEIISHHAHYTDLLVIGNDSGSEDKSVSGLAERLIMSSGRPVLVFPSSSSVSSIGKKVLVAWKAGREAARAVYDALPFLRKSERVTLLAINISSAYDDDDSLCSEVIEYLARHGVVSSVERVSAQQSSIGDALLNRTFEEGYDFLVMGAFARTPQGALLLGNAAKQMLQQSTVPILFSH